MSGPLQPVLWANLHREMENKHKDFNDLARFMGWSSSEQYNKWKKGYRRISLPSARRLAEFVGKTLDELDPSGEAFDPETRRPKQAAAVKAPAVDADDTFATAPESLDQLGRAMVRDLENPAIQEAVAAFKRLTVEQQEDAIDYMVGLRRGVQARTRGRKVGNR